MLQQTFKNLLPNAGQKPAIAAPRVHSLKKSQPSSETGMTLNIPEYIPDDGELLTDEFPKETMQEFWGETQLVHPAPHHGA